jgi:segregation and condensation protein B
MRKVEAALFIAGRFMNLQELVALTDVNPILLKKILEDLSDKYKECGVSLVNKENLWKMDVSPNYIWMVNRLAGGSSEFTKAEQETLALIAYKQPMKQSIVVKIRGNKAYGHINGFVERGLVNKKRMGHTAELTLNEGFFDYFSLNEGEGNFSLNLKENSEKASGEIKEEQKEEQKKDMQEMKEGE